MTHSFPPRRSSDLAHVEVDVIEGVAEPADVVVVAEPRLAHLAVEVEDLHRLAAGAHVDPRAAEMQVVRRRAAGQQHLRSEEHTSELQSLMRISYAVFCLKKKKHAQQHTKSIRSSIKATKR